MSHTRKLHSIEVVSPGERRKVLVLNHDPFACSTMGMRGMPYVMIGIYSLRSALITLSAHLHGSDLFTA